MEVHVPSKKPPKKTSGKSTKVLEDIGAIPDKKPFYRGMPGAAMTKANKPEVYAQVVEVIRDFLANGKTFRVFPTKTQLWAYLAGKDKQHPREVIFDAGLDAFTRFVERVRNGEEV